MHVALKATACLDYLALLEAMLKATACLDHLAPSPVVVTVTACLYYLASMGEMLKETACPDYLAPHSRLGGYLALTVAACLKLPRTVGVESNGLLELPRTGAIEVNGQVDYRYLPHLLGWPCVGCQQDSVVRPELGGLYTSDSTLPGKRVRRCAVAHFPTSEIHAVPPSLNSHGTAARARLPGNLSRRCSHSALSAGSLERPRRCSQSTIMKKKRLRRCSGSFVLGKLATPLQPQHPLVWKPHALGGEDLHVFWARCPRERSRARAGGCDSNGLPELPHTTLAVGRAPCVDSNSLPDLPHTIGVDSNGLPGLPHACAIGVTKGCGCDGNGSLELPHTHGRGAERNGLPGQPRTAPSEGKAPCVESNNLPELPRTRGVDRNGLLVPPRANAFAQSKANKASEWNKRPRVETCQQAHNLYFVLRVCALHVGPQVDLNHKVKYKNKEVVSNLKIAPNPIPKPYAPLSLQVFLAQTKIARRTPTNVTEMSRFCHTNACEPRGCSTCIQPNSMHGSDNIADWRVRPFGSVPESMSTSAFRCLKSHRSRRRQRHDQKHKPHKQTHIDKCNHVVITVASETKPHKHTHTHTH